MWIFIACYTNIITYLHLDVRSIHDYLCINMHQSHRYIFISRTNNQLRWIKMIPKLLLFCLSLQIKRMHLLATSKKPLLAPTSPDNWTFWSSQHQHCIHMMQTSTHDSSHSKPNPCSSYWARKIYTLISWSSG